MIRHKSFHLILVVCVFASLIGVNLPSVAAAPGANRQVISSEIIISDLNSAKFSPVAAYNSQHNEYLVVWENDIDGSNEIDAARVDSRGQILGGFIVTAGEKDRIEPTVAYDPVNDRYLVIWSYDFNGSQTDWDIYGRFIPWDGLNADWNEFVISAQPYNQTDPKVTYGRAPEEFLVVWANTGSSQNDYVAGRRVYAWVDPSSGDSKFPTSGSNVMVDHAGENLARPDIAHDLARNEYLMVYDNGNDIFGARLSWEAARLDGSEWVISSSSKNESYPSVASCHAYDQYLVAWHALNSIGSMEVNSRYISGDGAQEGEILVDAEEGDKENVRATCDWFGRDYWLTWQMMNADGYYSVRGRLMNSTRSEEVIELASAGYTESRINPAIAAGKGNALVVWEHQRDAYYWDIHARVFTQNAVYLPLMLKRFVE